jgi:hypothetical protein
VDTDLQTHTTLVQPTAVVPAALARHVPLPQPVFVPAGSAAAPGVVIPRDENGLPGIPYYGYAPIAYPPPSPLTDPQAVQGIVRAVNLAGGGVFAAGAGFGLAEVLGAASGASIGGLLAAAALIAVTKVRTPKRINVTQHVTENYDQRVTALSTGLFGRANAAIGNHKTSTTNIS